MAYYDMADLAGAGGYAACYRVCWMGDKPGSSRRAHRDEGIRGAAVDFIRAFYNDWEFDNGKATYATEAFNRRSLPYIEEGTSLYGELSKDNSFGMGSGSRFARTAALHAVEVKPDMHADDVCVVEVSYCGTQNDVTQEWYDDMMKRLDSATRTIAFDEDGKVSAMEEGDVADQFARISR